MIKKSLTLLLAILMVVSMMPINAFASSGITYVVEDAGETETPTPEPEGEESEQGGAVVSEETAYVAKIGETEYATFAGAMTAANAMTGDVAVDIYGEVEFVDGMELKGNYTSITFNGKASGAKITINQTAGGDYLEAHGKTVAFNDLILAKANPAWAGNSGHMGNYFSIQGGTATYTSCTFPNGACTSGGTATYNSCTFQNASEYGIWVYDDALVTVNGGTIDSKKGIKVYSEDEASVTSTLTVQNATFTANVTAKPAVAIGYAESITLIGNTYNNTTGVLELDSGSDADCEGITFVAEDAEGNDISSTLTAVDRSNGSAACGVLVDGKIYTTVTEAAKDATSGDTVTLLYNSTEDVEFAEGVTINKNNYTADNVTVAVPVAQIGDQKYTSLQAAIDAVQNGETIVLLADCAETITFTQTKDLSFVLDGNDKTMTGSINITARAGKGAESTLVIKNFKFTTDKTSHDFIKSVETNYYPNNITIQNCSFTGTGDINTAGYAVVAVRLKSANNILIKDCTGTGLHSFLQNTAGWVVNLDNVDVTNSLGGFAMGTVQGTNIKNCDLVVDSMGIRLDAQYNNNAVIEDCNVEAFIPVVVRKASVDSSISFNGTNTMTETNTDGLWCAIGTSEYKENGTMPTAPTGKVTVTLNDTGLSTDGLYGHYVEPPKGDTPHAYTSETTIWGQTWSNAKESYVIKIVDANGNVMGTSTLNTELDVSMDGDVEVTWHISLDPASDIDEYWIQEWTIAPSVTNIPTKVELWVDGVKVNEGNIRLNGPDDIAKIYAAEVDADGKITGYCTLDTFVSKISDLKDRRILVLRDVTFSSTEIRCVEFISGVEGGVTVTNTDVENWIDFDFVTIGKGVTVNVEYPYSGDSENVIEGVLVAGETYYHGYDAKTTIQNGGKVVVEGTTILRYNEEADSGIYVYGDGDSSTVEFDCGYYIGAYSGTFYVENANVECGYFLLKNSYDNSSYADIDMTLDNSTLTVAGTTDGQDSFIIDDQASLTLKNDSAIADVRDFNILAGADLDLTVDETSSIDATNVSIAEDVPFKYEDGIFAPKTFEKDSDTKTAVIYNLDGLKAFRDEVNGGTTFAGWTITLDADIDLNNEEWTPIGNSTNTFQGTFDGGNKTISNLVITGDNSNVGFFGFTTNGEIKNLTINNAKVTGYLNVAVVAGTPYTSKYTNIKVTGLVEVNGYAYVGGVGGKNAYANWTDITVDVDSTSYVEANSEGYRTYVGGVIGFIGEGGHTFKNISSNIKVIGSTYDIGGLFGIAHYGNNFENVTFTGSVEAPEGAGEVGGIAGVWHNQAGQKVTFTDVTSTGTVTVGGVDVTAEQAVVGGAYKPANNTPSNSGDLIIDDQSTWVKVAKIGDVQYATLQAAIDAVKEGETIVLLDNVTVAEAAYGQNALNHARAVSFTLDLNGKTLSANTGNSVFRFNLTGSSATSNVAVTIKNGTIVSGANTWCAVMCAGIDGAKAVMNLEDLTIESSKAGDLAIKAWENGLINAKDVTVNATNGAGGFYAVGGEIVLDNCTVVQQGLHTAPYLSMAFAVSNGGMMTINSGTYSAEPTAAAEGAGQGTSHGSWVGGVMNSGGTLIIKGGTFSNGNYGDDSLATEARGLLMVDTGATLEINGGMFNALKGIIDYTNNLGDATKNPVVEIYGGVYSAEVDDKYLGLGYTCVEENGTYRVKSAVEVKIGNKSYATLAEAVAAAKPGDTLLLQANVNIDAPIDVTKSIAIVDYGTYTITFTNGAGFVVGEGASLTLKDILSVGGISDVTVFAATPSYFVVVDGANANVTIDNVATDSSIYVSADADGSTIVADGKTVVLEEGAEGITITGTTSIEGAVAKIGDVYYSTLIKAATKAATSEEIVLVANTSVSGQNALDKLTGKTLNLDGKTLTVSGNSYFSDGTTTFKNGKIVVTGYATDSFFCGYTAGAVIVFDGVEIFGDSYKTGCAVFNANLGKVEVKNSTVTLSGDAEGGVFYGGAVSVDKSEITATNVCRGFTNSVATIANGSEFTFDGGETGLNNSTVTIDDSTVEIKNATKRAVRLHNNTLTVTNGSTLTATGCAEDIVYYDPTSEAQVVKSDDSTIAATIPSLEKVASIGTNRYFTLAEAFAAANDGDTITLLADVTVDTTIKVEANIILDLNGKTITGEDHATGSFALIEIQPSKELTVKDTVGTGKITLTATNNRGWNAYSSVISNQRGKLTVESGTIEHLGGTDMAYGIDNLTNGKGTYAETVINGGTIKSTYRAIRQFLNGVEAQNILTINGGTIEGGNKSVWMQDPSKNANTGSLTIGENATLKGDVYLFVTAGSTEWPVEVSIASAALKDGAKVTTGNVPAGYELAETNGTYGIMTGVAKIGNTYYATLADAIAAVGAGDVVIELIANATFDYNARDAYGTAETTSLTIDGNGYTLTLNQKNSDWASIGLANTNAKLVLNDMTIEKTGYGDTSGAWNTHAIIFSCEVEMNGVTVNNSVAVQNGATLTNVVINEANGYYGLWINGNGQTVTMTGGEINATNGGRGIKIADQYIDAPASVNLTVDGTKFNTAKKAAVLVSSTAGAAITASNVDITNVAEDSTNIAWVDEDWSTDYGKVTVTGGTLSQESVENFTMIVRDEDDNIIAYYDDLGELFADYKDSKDTIYVLLVADVSTNNVVYANSDPQVDFNFTTNVEGGVTITLGYTGGWNYIPHMTIGKNVTLNVPYRMCVYGKVLDIYGTVNTGYLYNLSGAVTVKAGGVLDVTTGDKTIQVKNNGWFEVYGTAKAGTVNVWNSNTRASQVIVSGANASLTADHIHAWDGGNATKANTVTVEEGATLTATNFQADRGSEVTVSNATVNATTITLGYDNNVGKLIESGNSVINGTINVNSTNATVKSDGGLENNLSTTKEGYKVVYDEENGVYKIAQYAIMVTYPVGNPVYPEGKVEYYDNMIDAVPYTTNCPRLEGATITLLNDVSGAGMRFMENGMVFDLNGHTYTITAGTGSQGTNTSGFQIRPEVTTNVIIKNGTIKVAEGAPVVWMFNCYATDFVVEDVTVDCTNMAWGYGESCYVAVSRSGDGIQLKGNTKVENFDAAVAGNAYSVGGTMTVEENVVVGGTIQLDAGATLVAREGLDVVAVDGYKLIYENGTYSTEKIVAKIGETAYTSLAAALAAAVDGDVITLVWSEGDASIAMNGSVYGKTVTITGTATVDWNKGFLFVGRGGAGNGTVIFDGANLTSASSSATYGIHVSGREKNTDNKYDGTLIIENSTIELDYLINRGTITLEEGANLTVKHGFGIAGRPASETENNEDATARITLNNGSKLVVKNHNGMGLGLASSVLEGYGIMTVNEGATFETTQAFSVSTKGTMNVNGGSVKITGTLTNNGTINVAGVSDIAATTEVTGAGWIYMNGVTLDADTKLIGAKVRFASGTNNIDGSVITDGFFQVGIGAYNGVDANVDTVNGVVVNVKNATIGSNDEAYAGWIGTGFYDTDAEKAAAMTDAKYVLNIENSVAEFGYLHVSNDGELNVKGNAAEKVWYNNSEYSFYAGDLIINGTATFDATDVLALYTKISCDNGTDKPGTLNIVNGTEFEAERHNGAIAGTNFEVRKTGVVNVAEGAKLHIGEPSSIAADAKLNVAGTVTALGTITNNGTITLTNVNATITTPEAPVINSGLEDYNVEYTDGTYKLVAKIYVAQINGGKKYESLQEAIDAAVHGDIITLLIDCAEDVTVEQKRDVEITIDGNSKIMTGTITVNGKSARYDTAALTIKNFNFDATNISKDACINLGGNNNIRYTNHVTVENCTFTGNIGDEKVGIKSYTGGCMNVTVTGCTAKGMHSLMQLYNTNGVTVSGCTITDSKNGISVRESADVSISSCTIDVSGYGIRADGKMHSETQVGNMTVSGVTIDAALPIVVRNTNANYELNLTGTNSLTATNTDGWQVIFTAGDDGTYVTPENVNVVMTGADDLKTFPVYGAEVNGVHYATLAEAIAVAKSGDIVTMLQNAEIAQVMIVDGVTIDLNGNILTAQYVVAFGGKIIDSKDGVGALKVPATHLMLNSMESYMAIYDAGVAGYRFFMYELAPMDPGCEVNGELLYFYVKPVFTNMKAYELLATADDGITIKAVLTWKNDQGESDPMYHTISAVDGWAAATATKGDAAYKLFVTAKNFSNLESVSMGFVIESQTGATISQPAVTYTVPVADEN